MSPPRGNRVRLAGAALLGALALACGGAAESAAAPLPATPDVAAPETIDVAAPQAPGEGPARPGGAPVVPRAGSGQGRPGGAPPGVRHDLPQLGDDLADQQNWEQSARDACNEAGYEANCITLTYAVHSIDGQGESRPIPDPGPNYFTEDPQLYYNCEVKRITPPTGDDVKVPPGTRVTIVVECEANDPVGPTTDPIPTSDPTEPTEPVEPAETSGPAG
jgi:hypothetical protein